MGIETSTKTRTPSSRKDTTTGGEDEGAEGERVTHLGNLLHAAAEEGGVGRRLLQEVVEHPHPLDSAQLAAGHNSNLRTTTSQKCAAVPMRARI